jgi:predicted nucleic acid-binding protein
MVAWYEFLCGPVTANQRDTVRTFLESVLPFDEEHAAIAAELYAAGRKRSLRVDAMIAAAAISANATLAPNNRDDFELFVDSDLELL